MIKPSDLLSKQEALAQAEAALQTRRTPETWAAREAAYIALHGARKPANRKYACKAGKRQHAEARAVMPRG